MKSRLRIKVCGMRDPGNIRDICSIKPEYLGYIFHPGSPRYVGEDPEDILFTIPGRDIIRVGVFVNEDSGVLCELVDSERLDLLQLHGSETPEFCRDLSERGIRIAKALGPGKLSDHNLLESYLPWIEYFVFDTPGPGYGGTGMKFDWRILESLPGDLPFMLSGGIGPGDAAEIRKIDLPGLFAVDVNSRFETEPGMKDLKLLRSFADEIRQ